jgi:putative FmdB family regulatory protein
VPIYEYRRADGSTFEVLQRMTDDPLTVDPETGAPVERVFHPVAVHLKGKGFYNTDYGKAKRAGGGGSDDKTESSPSSSSSDSSSSDSSSSSSSSESKSESSSSSAKSE